MFHSSCDVSLWCYMYQITSTQITLRKKRNDTQVFSVNSYTRIWLFQCQPLFQNLVVLVSTVILESGCFSVNHNYVNLVLSVCNYVNLVLSMCNYVNLVLSVCNYVNLVLSVCNYVNLVLSVCNYVNLVLSVCNYVNLVLSVCNYVNLVLSVC